MNYILIQNDGEIETNSFELIGASTKRNEIGKIGFFGSGLKYSIAYMMRKGIEFKIFSGLNEVKFTTSLETLKNQSFDRICINGKPTSYTVTMGPTWKEDWFVLREIYCNALDESGCQIVKSTELVSPTEGKTRIYIQITDELKAVCDGWDGYFAEDREPLFISSPKTYTCYLGQANKQAISVYKKTDGVLYRLGIRVYKGLRFQYDYGCDSVHINEDRTANNAGGLSYGIASMVAGFENIDYVTNILRTCKDEKYSYEYDALTSLNGCIDYSDKWIQFSKDNLLVLKESSGKYSEQIERSKREWFLIPTSFARELKEANPDVVILGMGTIFGNVSCESFEITPKIQFLLNEVKNSLKQLNYEIAYDIRVVTFDSDNVLGKADLKNKTILIGAQTFDLGRREIAMTLMEENEHLNSGHEEESRAFQTHLFSKWLLAMENQNGLFL